MNGDELFLALLDATRGRLLGVTRWDQLPGLGRANLARVLDLLRAASMQAMVMGSTREELSEIAEANVRVSAMLAHNALHRPTLPRLRNELFREGDAVRVYVGDSPGAQRYPAWLSGHITAVEKAYRADWNNGEPNGGYFWRSTIVTTPPAFADGGPLRCSTTEPRVLLEREAVALVELTREDPQFVAIFIENARRDFTPLWVLERQIAFDGSRVDVGRWVAELVAAGQA